MCVVESKVLYYMHIKRKIEIKFLIPQNLYMERDVFWRVGCPYVNWKSAECRCLGTHLSIEICQYNFLVTLTYTRGSEKVTLFVLHKMCETNEKIHSKNLGKAWHPVHQVWAHPHPTTKCPCWAGIQYCVRFHWASSHVKSTYPVK